MAEKLSPEDRDGIAALFDACYERLCAFVSCLPGGPELSESRDVAMTAFQEAIRNWHTIGTWDRPRQLAWLKAVCRNRRVDELRHRVGLEKLLPNLCDADARIGDPEEIALDRLALEACAAALRRMTPSQRQVAEMAWLLQLAPKDIAALLEKNEGTIRARLYRARGKLRREIGRQLRFRLADAPPGQDDEDGQDEQRREA
ncbi:RNA polymerase sigma factor [Streptomyces sp. G45]|uniref:RNA polymerase sigma factor n=1 Tax=Streptomyces sp. G45 TaxID=3406627 RepID=UPI003C1714D9